MSQPGAVVGGFILTALVTANFGLTNATIVIALGGVLVSGVVMMLARPVKTKRQQEVSQLQPSTTQFAPEL